MNVLERCSACGGMGHLFVTGGLVVYNRPCADCRGFGFLAAGSVLTNEEGHRTAVERHLLRGGKTVPV